MVKKNKTISLFKYRNRCYHCFKQVEIPMLPDQSYGIIMLKSIDGQDFYIADMIGNKTFSFIEKVIEEFDANKKTDPQDILALLADRPKGVALSKDYCCSFCKKKLLTFTANVKTVSVELEYAAWNEFESLTRDQQVITLRKMLNLEK